MRALWWKQPYGQLMAYGKIETRTWSTGYRGPVLICASKKGYSDRELLNISGPGNFNIIKDIFKDQVVYNGCAVAVGELFDCRLLTPQNRLNHNDIDKTFVKPEIAVNLWGHYYRNVKAIVPFPLKGALGWRTVTPEILEKIIYVDGSTNR